MTPNDSDAPDDPLAARITAALNRARKDRDRLRVTVLGSTLSELRNRRIELGHDLDHDDEIAVISKAVKQRREAADQMREGGREELARREELESGILREFLPPALDEDEVRRMVRELIESGITDQGPLMGQLMPQLKGRFEGREANRIVREELQGS